MRFHTLVPAFYPHDATGAIAAELNALFRQLGYDAEIFSPDIHPELTQLARPAAALVDAVGPEDVVVYHHGIGSEMVPLLSGLSCRKVLAYHNITPEHFFAPFDLQMARSLRDGRLQLQALRAQVDLALCFSAYSAAELQQIGFRRTAVIPPPVEPWRVTRAGDERLYRKLFDGQTRNLLFVGRVVPNKRIEDLLDLTARLIARNPSRPYRLVIAGAYQKASAYFRFLQERAKPLRKHVQFLGPVTSHELCACYRAAHLFLSMSEHEGFGLPLVEAMAAGVPVVAYDDAAVPEALGGAGVLFKPKRLDRVAALCEILLDDQQRRSKLSAAGRQRAAALSPEATKVPLQEALRAAGLTPKPQKRSHRKRPRIGFVIHRYGTNVIGGAERHCRSVALRLARHWDIDILTSCATDYLTWQDVHPAGTSSDGPVTVRRFPGSVTREMRRFNALSRRVLGRAQERLDEERWLRAQGPSLPGLYTHLAEQRDAYDGFVFFTYLYEPTAVGLPIVGKRALFVPTAHDEPPLRFGIYREVFAAPAAILFNTPEEQALCEGLFDMPGVHRETVGVGVEAEQGDSTPLLDRVGLRSDYLLYLGRIAAGKGIPELLAGYAKLRKRLGLATPALVLAGTDEIGLKAAPGVYVPGPLNEVAKWGALRDAAAIVVPSAQESLSLLCLEAWACGKAVLANGESPVLAGQAHRSQAAVLYRGPDDFAEVAAALLADPLRRERLGASGRAFVGKTYAWTRVEDRYRELMQEHVLERRRGPVAASPRAGTRREAST